MRKFSGFCPVAIIHYSDNSPVCVRAYNGREWRDDPAFRDVYSTFRDSDGALRSFIARYTGVRVPTCGDIQAAMCEYAFRYVGSCALTTRAAISRLVAATEFCGLSLAGAEPVPVRGDMAAYLWQHSGLAEAFWLTTPAQFNPARYYTFALDCGGTSYVRRVGVKVMSSPNSCPYYIWAKISADIMSVILAEIGYIVALYRRRVSCRP